MSANYVSGDAASLLDWHFQAFRVVVNELLEPDTVHVTLVVVTNHAVRENLRAVATFKIFNRQVVSIVSMSTAKQTSRRCGGTMLRWRDLMPRAHHFTPQRIHKPW